MTIDPTTNLGRVRLRIADCLDIPYLNDSTIQATLDENSGSVVQASKRCAMYILGMLAHKTHRRMAQLEVYGAEAFASYKEFLLLAWTNPAFMDFAPVPYSNSLAFAPILQFQADWNKGFTQGTEAQQLAVSGSISPNANDLYGPQGDASNGWQATVPLHE
jgi:hypothetical protein